METPTSLKPLFSALLILRWCDVKTGGYSSDGVIKGTSPRRVPRLSLVSRQSGLPLILLYLQEIEDPFYSEVRSLEKAETFAARANGLQDKKAWSYVQAFFEAGGSKAYVLGVPISKAAAPTLQSVLGRDAGTGRRTGIYSVLDWVEKTDLLCVPQVSEFLSETECIGFNQKVLDMLPDTGVFYLLDLPARLDVAQAQRFLEKQFSADASAFYPWLLVHGRITPPSVVVAAWLQVNDAQIGVGELGSHIPLPQSIAPLVRLSPVQRVSLLDSRINTFLTHLGQCFVWGGYTLADHADWKTRLIPLRRTTVKLKHAVEWICEPYVLEPVNTELSVCVENSLQNFLRSVRSVFNRDTQEPFTTSVKVIEEGGEERVQVGLNYALPHSVERFSLSFIA